MIIRKKFLGYLSALVITLATVLTLNMTQPTFAGDCDDNAIIRCGTSSMSALRKSVAGSNELQAVYNHYGLSSSVLNGATVKTGSVTKSGNVIVDGKTVATGAQSVGRQNMAGSSAVKIAGKTFYQRSTGVSFRSSALQAFVFTDANGKFIGAVIISCANPVVATPTPVPPKPQPKPAAACESISAQKVSRNQYKFVANASAINGATIKSYTFTINNLTNKQNSVKKWTVNSSAASVTTDTITLEPGSYQIGFYVSTSVGDRGDAKCATTFKVVPEVKEIQVCELKTDTIITIKESEFDSSKHSKDLKDCEKIRVCKLDDKTIITIKESEFDESKHSKDLDDCKEEPCPIPGKEHLPKDSPDCVETPVAPEAPIPPAIASTGPTEIIGAGIGLSSLTAAGYYFQTSRRRMRDAFLGR